MKKNIFILMAIIFAAILFRYIVSAIGTHKTNPTMVAPVTVTKVFETRKQKTF